MAGQKYPQTLHTASAAISTANANRDGTGTIGTVFTGVATGSFIQCLRITAGGATTDGMIRLYVNDGSYRLIAEIPVPQRTPSATLPVWSYYWVPPGGQLYLPGVANSLRASTQNAETFYLVAEGQDY